MSDASPPPLFLGARARDDERAREAKAALVGVPFDGAVTYRAGAKQGPTELRAASDSIESYCPKLDRDLHEFVYLDLGDLDVGIPDILGDSPGERLVRSLRRQLDALPDLPLVAIGGDHLVAYPFIERALEHHADLQILHIDAHMDLRDRWEGEPFNHATVMRRVLERMGPGHRIHQWGIRSGERREYRLAGREPGIEAIEPTLAALEARLDQLFAVNAPIYLTLDIDGIDPADIPGTGTPEPDGLRFGVVEAALGKLASDEAKDPRGRPLLVGADLVELAPALDPTGRSQVAAARLVRGMLLVLAN